MKSKKKVLVTLLCAALLVFASVMGTLAYLQAQTDVATNTFTVGNIQAYLDEADVNEYGDKLYVQNDEDKSLGTTKTEIEAKRVLENEYKLIPGHPYVKDPTIHIVKGSEECYVFVKVVDEIAAIQDDVTVADQMDDNWVVIDQANGIYAYKQTVNAMEAEQDVVVFSNFKIKSDADVAAYEGKTITITGYAVQVDGFGTAQDAWNATYGK